MQKPLSSSGEISPPLVFTSDEMPGYTRIRRGRGFSYHLPNGALLKDLSERRRIISLAIPPAYKDVWICRLANGHLQATGIDARGRKQYRYHPAWSACAADRKFSILPQFVASLPHIRQAARRVLAKPELSRERVIAGIVMLLDQTGYRIGNFRYEQENRSYGLSSLHSRHVRLRRDHILLRFRGKSGMEHEAEISDEAILKLVHDLQDLPGQHLFRYNGEGGEWHDIDSADVNGWLRKTSGAGYTAKQFRTWKATTLCCLELKKQPPPDTKAEVRQLIHVAIKSTASQLHHTVATCRKYYIHPALLRAYADGSLHRIMKAPPPRLRKSDDTARLRALERRVYKIITGPS